MQYKQCMYAHVNVMISVEMYIETKGAEMIRYHKIDQGIKSDFTWNIMQKFT